MSSRTKRSPGRSCITCARARADFQFLGWSSRRYRTWGTVLAIDDEMARLVLHEWHPARPVQAPVRIIVDAVLSCEL